MRTLLIVCLTLSAAACFAQTAAGPSVAVGQNAAGQPIVVQLIPLKFLDPVEAVNIMTALGFPGTVLPINGPHRPGESPGSSQGQNNNNGYGSNNTGNRNNGSRWVNQRNGNGNTTSGNIPFGGTSQSPFGNR